jgi:hypothetical protein
MQSLAPPVSAKRGVAARRGQFGNSNRLVFCLERPGEVDPEDPAK